MSGSINFTQNNVVSASATNQTARIVGIQSGTSIQINGSGIDTERKAINSLVVSNNRLYIDDQDIDVPNPTNRVLQLVVIIKGHVDGNVSITNGIVKVKENVQGDVRTISGCVNIKGNVAGRVSSTTGDIIVDGNVDGSVSSFSGNITTQTR